MPELSPSLRKAAVLIAALEPAQADALLDQMCADEAAKIRRALMELNDVPAEEQQQVLADFLRKQQPPSDKSARDNDDVALELDPQVEAAAVNWPVHPAPPTAAVTDHQTFDFLEQVEPPAIARLLRNEHPQMAAVVVSHLSPQQAAQVLEELPAELAIEALERIATLDAVSPDVLADLARGLRRSLAPHQRIAGASAAPLTHLSAVLEAMDYRQRQGLLGQLGQRNTALLKRLGMYPSAIAPPAASRPAAAPRYRLDAPVSENDVERRGQERHAPTPAEDIWLKFDDLAHFSDAALKAIFAAADAELVLLALTGAEPRLVGRILRKLPPHEAAMLRQRLEHPAAVRLRDIEQARAALAAVASRLAHEGSIDVPAQLGFAAAV